MNAETLMDTLEAIRENQEEQKAQIDFLQELNYKKDAAAMANRRKHQQKKDSMERDLFIKHYVEGSTELLDARKRGDISFSDLGKFTALCAFIQQDTTIIAHPVTRKPMNITDMANELGDYKQNLGPTLSKLIRFGLIIVREIEGAEVYCVNEKYAFNGPNRKSVTMVFNKCSFGDNANIIGMIEQ